MEHESCQQPQRNREHPQKDIVRQHEHLRITAAPQHAFGHDAVGGLEDHDKADGIHQLLGDHCRLSRHIVSADDRPADQQDDTARKQAETDSQSEKCIALLLCLFAFAFSQCLSGHDGPRLRDTLCQHITHLLCDTGDRIGCHESHTQTANDHRHRIVADGENAVTDQHRYTDTDIFPYQILRLYEKISQPEIYFLIFEKEIAADHPRLEQPGDQCPDRRAGDLHPWHSEFTEDKRVVGAQIDKEGAHRHI